jgi:hypothetical protein
MCIIGFLEIILIPVMPSGTDSAGLGFTCSLAERWLNVFFPRALVGMMSLSVLF